MTREKIPDEVPIRRRTEVPKRQKPPGEIIRLAGGKSVSAICLSPKFWGYDIHFDTDARRSYACLEDAALCKGCRCLEPVKSKYYLCVSCQIPGVNWIEFTEVAARTFMEQAGERSSYRGLNFTLTRTASSRGRLNVVVNPYLERDGNTLPSDQDPEVLLRWLWNRESR
jgi:hypothetical protein